MEAIKYYYYAKNYKIESELQGIINFTTVSDSIQELIILKITKEYLSFKYNIDDWMPCEYLIDKKYFDEIKQIEDKYNVKLPHFHNFDILDINDWNDKCSWQYLFFMEYLALRIKRMKDVDAKECKIDMSKLNNFLDEFAPED